MSRLPQPSKLTTCALVTPAAEADAQLRAREQQLAAGTLRLHEEQAKLEVRLFYLLCY